MLYGSHADGVLLHQSIGLDAYNALPLRRAVHAVYECCYSVPLAADLARSRPYPDHDALLRRAEELLADLGQDTLDTLLQAYPLAWRDRLERMLGPEGGYDNW